jgi:hypothetical protein
MSDQARGQTQRSPCETAIGRQDVGDIAAMLRPDVRWYGLDGRPRAPGEGAVVETARAGIAEGILRGARLTTWERVGDRLVIGVALEGRSGERVFLCQLAGDRITEVHDFASREDALASLAGG